MNPLHLLWRGLILGAVVCFACRLFAAAPDEPTLTKDEMKAVMARRDKIVAQFQKMISEKGEKEVLY